MIERYQENSRMSQVVRFGQFVETAGQVADDVTASVEEQSRQTLVNVEHLLKKAGAEINDLVRIQVWLDKIEYFDAFNVVYEEWLAGYRKPVRACVESVLVPGYKVEVQAFAFVSG